MNYPRNLTHADILSCSVSATIDVGRLEDKEIIEKFEKYLQREGYEITKETKYIWTVSTTQ